MVIFDGVLQSLGESAIGTQTIYKIVVCVILLANLHGDACVQLRADGTHCVIGCRFDAGSICADLIGNCREFVGSAVRLTLGCGAVGAGLRSVASGGLPVVGQLAAFIRNGLFASAIPVTECGLGAVTLTGCIIIRAIISVTVSQSADCQKLADTAASLTADCTFQNRIALGSTGGKNLTAGFKHPCMTVGTNDSLRNGAFIGYPPVAAITKGQIRTIGRKLRCICIIAPIAGICGIGTLGNAAAGSSILF